VAKEKWGRREQHTAWEESGDLPPPKPLTASPDLIKHEAEMVIRDMRG